MPYNARIYKVSKRELNSQLAHIRQPLDVTRDCGFFNQIRNHWYDQAVKGRLFYPGMYHDVRYHLCYKTLVSRGMSLFSDPNAWMLMLEDGRTYCMEWYNSFSAIEFSLVEWR